MITDGVIASVNAELQRRRQGDKNIHGYPVIIRCGENNVWAQGCIDVLTSQMVADIAEEFGLGDIHLSDCSDEEL